MRDRPDELYEAEIHSVFGQTDSLPRMDFVLLGMGGDCHTASLFPNSDAIHVNDRLIVVNDGERHPAAARHDDVSPAECRPATGRAMCRGEEDRH
ncbi:MAG: 6-phosphogluconolactonase [Phycisphaerales bacterium]